MLNYISIIGMIILNFYFIYLLKQIEEKKQIFKITQIVYLLFFSVCFVLIPKNNNYFYIIFCMFFLLSLNNQLNKILIGKIIISYKNWIIQIICFFSNAIVFYYIISLLNHNIIIQNKDFLGLDMLKNTPNELFFFLWSVLSFLYISTIIFLIDKEKLRHKNIFPILYLIPLILITNNYTDIPLYIKKSLGIYGVIISLSVFYFISLDNLYIYLYNLPQKDNTFIYEFITHKYEKYYKYNIFKYFLNMERRIKIDKIYQYFNT